VLVINGDPTCFVGVSGVDFLLDSQNLPLPGTLVHSTWNVGEVLAVRGVPPSGTLPAGQAYRLTSVREASCLSLVL